MSNFIFTCGDINGIGPEIVIKALNTIVTQKKNSGFYFICPANVFNKIILLVKPKFRYVISSAFRKPEPGEVVVINPGNVKIHTGKPTDISGKMSFSAIEISFALLKHNYADAVITAPVSKTALRLAGVEYTGHTEMFADWCNTKDYAMTFLSAKMNAALATIHHPLKNVSGLITTEKLNRMIHTLIKTLKNDLNVSSPLIAVLGLNPHAGENGSIGTEEETILKPLLKQKEIAEYLSGPYSADAFFANKLYKNFDMVMGMYHDQVLIPFKLLNFNSGVNYTAGLPVVRTSPDHGTAFDIAWKNAASESSIVEAFRYADKISRNRRKNVSRG